MNSKKIIFIVLITALYLIGGGSLPAQEQKQDKQDKQDKLAKQANTAGVTTGSPTTAQINDNTYMIGPQDILVIRVFGVPDLNTRVRVSGSNSVTLPLLGEVTVGGLTPAQVENKLAELLEKSYLKNPQVTVFIEEYRSNKVAVIGAVTNPGNFELIGNETLLQLISKAGGLTERAADRVVVIHLKTSRIINLRELMMKGTPELNVQLHPGDIINIPHERFIDIYIFGQIRNPGTLRIRRSGQITLLKAVAQAGGFIARARKSGIIVKRQENGKEIKIKLNINKIIKGKRPPFILKHDDIIYVPETLF
ncbi:MAG: hypothetical protein GY765_33220 [bacterium]|nr:hypothetical protein [bacterium]